MHSFDRRLRWLELGAPSRPEPVVVRLHGGLPDSQGRELQAQVPGYDERLYVRRGELLELFEERALTWATEIGAGYVIIGGLPD